MFLRYTEQRRTKYPVLVTADDFLGHALETNQKHQKWRMGRTGIEIGELGNYSAVPIKSDPGSKEGNPRTDWVFA